MADINQYGKTSLWQNLGIILTCILANIIENTASTIFYQIWRNGFTESETINFL